MEPGKKFEGCGSYNKSVKTFIEKQFADLNRMLVSMSEVESPDKSHLSKTWLIACLAKTLKEQIKLQEPLTELFK